MYDSESHIDTKGTKQGLSRDHLIILKKCKNESTALELMKILKRTNKSKFKTAIINPLIDHNFLELQFLKVPKVQVKNIGLTGKFVKRRVKD